MNAHDIPLMVMAAAPLAALLGAIAIVALIIRRQARQERTRANGLQSGCLNSD